jgi:hypothetical protein
MKQKSAPTIKQAVFQEYKMLPDKFRGHDLIKEVRIVTGRKYVYGDSVLRKLRVLKAEGKVNYELAAEKRESLYHKLC